MDSYPATPVQLGAEEDPLNARDEGVTCSICLDVLVRPIVLECQHVVCRPCYLDYLEANRSGWRLGLLPGWEVGMVVCPLGRCEIPAGCPPVNTVLQHLIESRYSSYIEERIKTLPPVAQEAKRARALDEVGLAARAAEWPHPEWNPWVPEPEVSLDWRNSPRMGAVAWCIELAFIASLMLVYNIQWNRALSARSASGTGKSVWATRRAIRGMDFACAEDADGSTPDACQIRCGTPCIEPFLQCKLQPQCRAVALNAEGSFGTLKSGRPSSYHKSPAAWRECRSSKAWLQWLHDEHLESSTKVHAAATDETWRDAAAASRVAAAAAPSPRPRVVQLALLPVVGRDFHCTGADGSAPGKCQVRCGKDDALVRGGVVVKDGACLEAWQRCVALPRCELVELDPEWRWATLKVGPPRTQVGPPRMTLAQRLHALRSGSPQATVGGLDVHNASEWRAHHAAAQLAAKRLPLSARARVAAARGAAPAGEAEAAAAIANQTVALWEAALGRLANESASVPPTADAQEAAHRPVMLALDDVRRHDFTCPGRQGPAQEACQVKCEDEGCVAAYRMCLQHSVCVAVFVNAERTYGTLKTSVQDGQEIVVVLSEAEWQQQLRPQLEHRWREHHRSSLQHALTPGGGVLDVQLQRGHPMARPGHAHTSAPYWRLQHIEPARGFFTTLLGGI